MKSELLKKKSHTKLSLNISRKANKTCALYAFNVWRKKRKISGLKKKINKTILLAAAGDVRFRDK